MDNVIVPEGFGDCLGGLGSCDIDLGILGKVVQAQVVNVDKL